MAAHPTADASLGVLETLLVLDGEPVELGAHLRRLAASLAELYGVELQPDATKLATGRAAGHAHGRLRLRANPAGELIVEIEPTAPAGERGVALRSHELPGGLGAHKWADRSALPELTGGEVALLLDRGGEVLEAAWANVFAVHGGVLLTPPLDGRILPGVTRATAIELASDEGIEVRERPIRHEELLAADEVFLTSSVRGVVPTLTLDGSALGRDFAVARALAGRLRMHWLGAAGPSRDRDEALYGTGVKRPDIARSFASPARGL